MNNYEQIIKDSIAKYNTNLSKIEVVAKNLVEVGLEDDLATAIFSDSATLRYHIKYGYGSLLSYFKLHLIQSSWSDFFKSVDLYKTVGADKFYTIVDKYSLKHDRFLSDISEVDFTEENLSKFVKEHLEINSERNAAVPSEFLKFYVGDWKARKTEYKSRVTVREFHQSKFLNDRVQHAICELAVVVTHELYNETITPTELKAKINYSYGVEEIELELVKGINFKLKPNGNVDLKFSKEVLGYLNDNL